jgi:uncharacterized protein (TIRG00374 family)
MKKSATAIRVVYYALLVILFLTWTKGISFNSHMMFVTIKNIRIEFLAISVVLICLAICLRVFRIMLLASFFEHKIAMVECIKIYFVSNFFSNVTPMKAGELSKPILFKKLFGVPLADGLAITILDRFFEIIVLVSSVALVIPIFLTVDSTYLLALLALCLPYLLVSITPKSLIRLISSIQESVNNSFLDNSIKAFKSYLQFVNSKSSAYRLRWNIQMLLLSAVIFVIEISSVGLIFKSFGYNVGFPILAFSVVASFFSGFISQTPGGAITTEWSFAYIISGFSVPFEVSLTSILIARFFGVYLTTGAGFLLSLGKDIST